MDRLWAPWRMAYILSGAELSEECIFCAFPAQPARWREHLVLAVGRHSFVMMNKYPYNNGHLMVIPRRHVGDPGDLPAEEYAATGEMLRAATRILGEAVKAQGFNIGMNLGRVAGAGIENHCHWHIVPRWHGDTNYMPVVGEVKVMSQHLEDGYDTLRPLFAPLDAEP